MAWRIYFTLGDMLACVTVGAASGWLTAIIVPGDWFVLATMAIGMIFGGILGVAGATLFTPFFGSFEVMLPASLSGMAAGMAFGMIVTVAQVGEWEAVWGGGLIGLVCLGLTYLLQYRLRGEAT